MASSNPDKPQRPTRKAERDLIRQERELRRLQEGIAQRFRRKMEEAEQEIRFAAERAAYVVSRPVIEVDEEEAKGLMAEIEGVETRPPEPEQLLEALDRVELRLARSGEAAQRAHRYFKQATKADART